jgi:hypothetical protein
VARAAVLLAVAAAAALAAGAQRAAASPAMRVGIFDQTQFLHGPPAATFGLLQTLNVRVIRVNLKWGGKDGVARTKPRDPANPNDKAYHWNAYDRVVTDAAKDGAQVLFSIYGTPPWANGGKPANVAPRFGIDLRNFAYAAATRYSGSFAGPDGASLPAVRDWLAWTEPNDPTFLTPQYQQIGGTWVIESAISYAAICNAVYSGIHATPIAGERVACGGTAPGGNNDPTSPNPSVGPLSFLSAAKKAGLLRFDAWAHDPYTTNPADAPNAKPTPAPGVPTPVTLGNIDLLTNLLTTLYGFEPLWITQYGYETNPPDKATGVTLGKQAQYLTQAFGIARANPRIQLMLWYLLKDEARSNGTQSGLVSTAGKKKPSFVAFRKLGESA